MCERTLILNAEVIASDSVRKDYGLFLNEDGRIADVFSMEDFNPSKYGEATVLDAKGALASPGLFDTHIHGILGFGTDDGKAESILQMSKALPRFGVTAFLPTLYAGRTDKMVREIEVIVRAIGKEEGARIAGIHLEGPFLNPARCGAQDPKSLCLPSEKVMKTLLEAGKGHIKAMTIAPELPGTEEVASMAAKAAVVLLMGHTDATYEQAKKAMDIGILHTTHTFNAMSPLNHKRPGVSGAALMDDRMRCEIIADGVHVNRDLVLHLIRSKRKENVVLVTDSLTPTGLGDGVFKANGDDVVLGSCGAFVEAGNQDLLCGSALTLNRAVANVAAWGVDTAQAVRMASGNPARIYGLMDTGFLAKGCKADVVLFDKTFKPVATFVEGRRLKV